MNDMSQQNNSQQPDELQYIEYIASVLSLYFYAANEAEKDLSNIQVSQCLLYT